jgi:hypothetical protein
MLHGFMHNYAGPKNMRKKTREIGHGQSLMGEYLVSCPRKGVKKKQGASMQGWKTCARRQGKQVLERARWEVLKVQASKQSKRGGPQGRKGLKKKKGASMQG